MSTHQAEGQPPTQPPQQQTIADTGQGFLQGVQPAQPRQANDWTGQQPQQYPQQQTNGNGQPQQQFTAEDIERARQQEKDKLYGRIEEMGTQLQQVLSAREQEEAERKRLADEAETARKEKEESEMDLRALLEKRDKEWEDRFKETESQYATDRAIFEQERKLAELDTYRRQRVEQEQEEIIPALLDMVSGNSPEEIEQSILFMKERSNIIASNFAAAAQQSQQQVPFRGAAMPSVPPVGPLEQLPANVPITDALVKGMSMDDYKKNREQLLRMTNPNNRRQG
jgi:hypothetical protein